MGEMAEKLNDRHLANLSQKCTHRSRDQRPNNAQEVMQDLDKRTFPWRIWAFIIAGLCLIALGLFLWEHSSMLHDDATLLYEPDSLTYGNNEVIH